MLHSGSRSQAGLRASAPIRLVDSDDGMVRLEGSPGVVIATDIPVREYVPGVGYARVSLRMTKAMLGRWRESGALDPNGHLLMAVAHNPRYSPNPALSSLGRWENLRVEERDGHKALVADPAFDPASMSALMRRIGAEPEDWRGMIERGTIQRTSIWWSGSVTRDNKDKAEPPLFTADPWEGREGSWVALGADPKSGANRSTHEDTTMDSEQLEAMMTKVAAEAARKGAQEAIAALQAPAPEPAPAPAPTPEPAATRTLDEDPTWIQLQDTARSVLGAGALDAANAARAKGTPAEAIAALSATISAALQKRTAGGGEPPKPEPAPVPVRHRIEDGDVAAYRALSDLEAVMVARGMRDVPKGDPEERTQSGTLAHARQAAIDAAVKVARDYETVDPRHFLVEFMRAMGIVEQAWYSYSEREIMERLASDWSPSGQEHVATMGGRWYGARDAVMANGSLDVLGTMRHGAAGSLVPADAQAIFLAIVTKIFLTVHDSQSHMLNEWGRMVALSDLNAQTLVRHDLALSFDKAVSNQDLPEAQLFSEGTDIKTEARGVVWSYGWESMFTDGAQVLTGVPALLAMRWMSAKIAHWFKRLFAGQYTPKGEPTITVYTEYADQGQVETDLAAWFKSVAVNAGKKRPVKPPDVLAKGLAFDQPLLGTMEPTLLLYGNETMDVVANHFAARQLSQVNQTTQDRQLNEFELKIRRNTVRTPYIQDDSMYALITSGPATAMTAAGLDGRGMRITSRSDVNIRQLPSNVVRIEDTFAAHLTHPHGVYRNKLT